MRYIVIGLLIVFSIVGNAICSDSIDKKMDLSKDDFALIAHYANAFLNANNGTGGYRTIYAQDLVNGIETQNKLMKLSDFHLIDIRNPTDYSAGHIPGAINVQLGDLAKPEVLATLPTDRPILVVCYTGHTASIATAILCILGYDAWTLRFGMLSWDASTPTGIWSHTAKQDIKGGNYSMVRGSQQINIGSDRAAA